MAIDTGLSDAQKQAAHAAMTKEFWAHYTTWLAEQDYAAHLREYPVDDLLASVGAPAANLVEAAGKASLIVVGHVDSVDFRVTATDFGAVPDTQIRLIPERSLKGDRPSSFDIVTPCQLMPSPGWQSARIACVEAVPMLYPGDSVVLLLDPNGDGRTFGIQPWTGLYWLNGGSVKAVAGNPFGPTTASMTADQLEQALAGAAR